MSLTDEISSQLVNKAENVAQQAVRGAPQLIKGTTDAGKNALHVATTGIVLLFKAPFFTKDVIMTAVGKLTKNPSYSKRNITIDELEKNSDIKQVDQELTKKEMQIFDKACKKYGVKYTATVDRSEKGRDPTWMVFFKGKETAVIEQAMKEAYKNYMKELAKPKVSVRAKLAFFRNRVAARDQAQQDLGKERHNNRADRQR